MRGTMPTWDTWTSIRRVIAIIVLVFALLSLVVTITVDHFELWLIAALALALLL